MSLAIPLFAGPPSTPHDDDIGHGLPATVWVGQRWHPGRDALPVPATVVEAYRDDHGFVFAVRVRLEGYPRQPGQGRVFAFTEEVLGAEITFRRELLFRNKHGVVEKCTWFHHKWKKSPSTELMRTTGLTLGVCVGVDELFGAQFAGLNDAEARR